MKVKIYTDGASKGNPGPGGYGAILKFGKHEKELSGGFRKTTNNRMELLAVIVALENLKKDNLEVEILSDSKYVCDAINKKWVFGWEKKNFEKKKNPDLWKRYLLLHKKHNINVKWVKGHDGHFYNERCDELAVNASLTDNLNIDEAYEKLNS